jgi:F-type H+-transporting ATPase subunit a
VTNVLAIFTEAEGEGSAVEFPPIENVVEWPAFFGEGTFYEFNKIALIGLIAVLVPVVLFLVARGSSPDSPSKVRVIVESIVKFIEEQIAKPGIGHGYEPFVPLLTSLFLFIAMGNLFEVIPFFQMPMNARMANPLVLAITVWVIFIFVGFKNQGFAYFKDIIWPSHVPLSLRPLVGFIELFSVFIVRPFSHAIRLFANMLAGHMLLITFSVLIIATGSQIAPTVKGAVLAFGFVGSLVGLIGFTAFELGVGIIQAFVFSILAAVYIGSSLHPAH